MNLNIHTLLETEYVNTQRQKVKLMLSHTSKSQREVSINSKQQLMCSQHAYQLKLIPPFSNPIQEVSLIHQDAEPTLTMQLPLLVMELKTELNTQSLETHGELTGVKMGTLELLLPKTDQEFVESC